jgi:hypothetical protein
VTSLLPSTHNSDDVCCRCRQQHHATPSAATTATPAVTDVPPADGAAAATPTLVQTNKERCFKCKKKVGLLVRVGFTCAFAILFASFHLGVCELFSPGFFPRRRRVSLADARLFSARLIDGIIQNRCCITCNVVYIYIYSGLTNTTATSITRRTPSSN